MRFRVLPTPRAHEKELLEAMADAAGIEEREKTLEDAAPWRENMCRIGYGSQNVGLVVGRGRIFRHISELFYAFCATAHGQGCLTEAAGPVIPQTPTNAWTPCALLAHRRPHRFIIVWLNMIRNLLHLCPGRRLGIPTSSIHENSTHDADTT